MPFLVMCLDKPGMVERRNATRAAHLEYLAERLALIRSAGPLTTDDGRSGVGSLYLLDIDTRAEAEAFVRDEPYARAEMFELVAIRRWRDALPEATPGQLAREIALARDASRNRATDHHG